MEEKENNVIEEKQETADEVVNDPNLEEAAPGEEVNDHYVFPWKGFLIVFGVIITLIVVCVIVILANGGFYQW